MRNWDRFPVPSRPCFQAGSCRWGASRPEAIRRLSPDVAAANGTLKASHEETGAVNQILDLIRRKKLRYVEAPSAIQYSDYSRKKGQSFWNSLNIVFDLLMEKLFR